ncbi:MAG TPA: indole-3-glycerol phosphate synthase TrpC [Firmicutes bacterium]|nr:indole-3-glycerol phosphate synthase TrpC [Bacillota bacterium]
MAMLKQIVAHKRKEISWRRRRLPQSRLEELCRAHGPTVSLSFTAALRRGKAENGMALIAEMKKKSPSKGLLRADFSPTAIARDYTRGGAHALSVLTDSSFFGGRLHHLDMARRVTALPLLRKDFIIDPYQVYEARAHGAAAVLLIAALLSPSLLAELAALTVALGMDPLVEVHDEADLAKVLSALPGLTIIGINNRDLGTFETSLSATRQLLPLLPRDVLVVSESGISGRHDIEQLMEWGVAAVLVGEWLMRRSDPVSGVKELLGKEDRDVALH